MSRIGSAVTIGLIGATTLSCSRGNDATVESLGIEQELVDSLSATQYDAKETISLDDAIKLISLPNNEDKSILNKYNMEEFGAKPYERQKYVEFMKPIEPIGILRTKQELTKSLSAIQYDKKETISFDDVIQSIGNEGNYVDYLLSIVESDEFKQALDTLSNKERGDDIDNFISTWQNKIKNKYNINGIDRDKMKIEYEDGKGKISFGNDSIGKRLDTLISNANEIIMGQSSRSYLITSDDRTTTLSITLPGNGDEILDIIDKLHIRNKSENKKISNETILYILAMMCLTVIGLAIISKGGKK